MTNTRPSADCGSDNQLLVAKLNITLRQKKRRRVPVMFDTGNTSRVHGRTDEHVCIIAKGGRGGADS